ncbi:DUF4215 domain-containing protein [Nannocystaceae bacterium ST9]
MSRTTLLGLVGVLGFSPACQDDASDEPGADESGETTPIYDPPEPECGNGYLEPGEDCDDANLLDGDGCDSLCRLPCGLAFEARLSVAVSDVSATIVDMAIADSGDIVIAATNEALSSELDDDLWLGRWNGAGELLWSDFFDVEGDDQAAAVVVDSQGRMILAGTVGAADGGTDAWLRAFTAEGVELWTRTYGGALVGSKDGAGGLALAPDGSLVISGFRRVADKDGDAWVARLDPDDGTPIWDSFWSGEPAANGYSLDVGGSIHVDATGRIWTLVREYVDFETFDVHLQELAADGSGVVFDLAPQAGGTAHEHVGAGLATAADGRVYFGIARLGAGSTFWVHALEPASGELAWVREMPSFVDEGESWTLRDLAVSELGPGEDGLLFVAGDLVRDESEDVWAEAFLHRLDAAGQTTCATRYTAPGEQVVAPDLFVGAVAGDAEANLIAAGRLVEADDSRRIWLGSFRGP